MGHHSSSMSGLITPNRQSSSLPNTRSSSPTQIIFSNDQLMAEPPSRPSLSTSVSDFALPTCSSSTAASSSTQGLFLQTGSASKDDPAPLISRLRRPTYIGMKTTFLSETRVHSPLASSFTLPFSASKRRDPGVDSSDVSDGDRFRDGDRMMMDSSPSSGSDVPTPPLLGSFFMEETCDKPKYTDPDVFADRSPSTPPRAPSAPTDLQDPSPRFRGRRLSYPPKPPRLLTLANESRPEEIEVKSEAQFQRLLASYSGLSASLGHSRTTKAMSDRGRYPEEAGEEDEVQREDTPSDDGVVDDEGAVSVSSFKASVVGSEPINITRPTTPSYHTSDAGDETILGISESPGASTMMDIDMPGLYGSPSLTSGPPPINQWRQTPPPTSSAVRTSKRKYEDRFDPYLPSAKRRAVSPSISSLRDAHGLVSPIVIPRSPILKPRAPISQSQSNSATSSPTVSHSSSGYGTNGSFANALSTSLSQAPSSGHPIHVHHRSGSLSCPSISSSPTVRASMILASPVLRPVARLAVGSKRSSGDTEGEKEVEGAGEAVGSLSLG